MRSFEKSVAFETGTVYPTVDELIVALMHAVELFETQQFDEVRADEEREARERKETGEGEQSVPIDQTKQELKQAQGQGWKLEENVKRNIEKKEEVRKYFLVV